MEQKSDAVVVEQPSVEKSNNANAWTKAGIFAFLALLSVACKYWASGAGRTTLAIICVVGFFVFGFLTLMSAVGVMKK